MPRQDREIKTWMMENLYLKTFSVIQDRIIQIECTYVVTRGLRICARSQLIGERNGKSPIVIYFPFLVRIGRSVI